MDEVFQISLMQASIGSSPPGHGVSHSVMGVCSFVIVFLSCLWGGYGMMSAVGKDSYLFKLSLLCISFAACSWGMNVLNKALVDTFHAPCLVTGAQMIMTVIGVVLLSPGKLVFDPGQVLRWCLVPFLFFGMLVSSFFTYEYLTLSMLMVIRNLGPLVTLPIETAVMPADKQPHISMQSGAALALLVVAAVTYSGGVSTSIMGVAFAVLNMVLAILDRVVQRRLLTTECKGLSTETCVFLNNSLGCVPTAVLGWWLGEHHRFDATLWFQSSATLLLILSGIIGSGICYFAIAVQREISAVSFMVLQNSARVAVVVVGIAIFHDPLNRGTQVLGLILSFGGAIAYGQTQLLASRAAQQKAAEAAEADPEKQKLLQKGK